MTNVELKNYLTDMIFESMKAISVPEHEEDLNYYFDELAAEDYLSAFIWNDNIYSSDCYFEDDTFIASMYDVKQVWDEALGDARRQYVDDTYNNEV